MSKAEINLGEAMTTLNVVPKEEAARVEENLERVIPKAPENPYYEVREVTGKGYGCFALKDLQRGTRILADDPLLIVPMADYLQVDIQAAFNQLTQEQKSFYFTLHSGHGQDPRDWPSKIHPAVTGRERQRIAEQHNARVGKAPTLISIFQTNCMEMDKGAAVFPNAARFNHSCNPNASFYWNSKIGKEIIHIMNDINKGDEITISYCDMTHEKPHRVWELRHYGFVCDCLACAEDEDDEKTFAYKSAQRRYRLHELDRETRFFRGQNLPQGAAKKDFIEQLLEMAGIYIAEGHYSAGLAHIYLDIALICELAGDLSNAERVSLKALEVKKACQGADFPDFDKYEQVVLRIKSKIAHQ